MSNGVVIKSSRQGVNLVLDDQTPFPELLETIGDKFRGAGNFFHNAKVAVSFEGRKLTDEQKQAVIETIMANADITITGVIEEGAVRRSREQFAGTREQRPRREQTQEMVIASDFYKGNLRSGQVLESASNVTLIGDVNPGAKIIAQGNVVVLGSIRGYAWAGASGDDGCFIFALDMRPIQLQIGKYIAKSPDRSRERKRLFGRDKSTEADYSSKVALIRNGNICLEPMTKGCLDHL